MSKYIYHHLGLGDHIICNGIVRHYRETNDTVYLFVKPHNFDNVSYMYKDDDRIILLPIGEDVDVDNYIIKNKISEKVIRIGFEKLHSVSHSKFDDGFYKCIDLPFEYRFDKFKYVRNLEIEKSVFDTLNPNKEKFIFTHGVDLSKVRSDLKIINNPTQYKIFDLLHLIEMAEEVHLMESSIKNLVNSYKFEYPKFFFHRYSRNYPSYNETQGLNEYTYID